jgi:ATP-dependent RNA helicase MSS116, mitochondrial
VTGIEESVKNLIPRLDEDSIRETFVSMLGYYIPKSGEIRAQRPIIVQGAKDWTTDACGLPRSPYVSDTFLVRLGITDGRTKRFGTEPDQASRNRPSATDPQMSMRRGRISTRQSKGELSWKDAESLQLDERDPRTAPEKYRTNLYGKSNPTLLDDDNISRSRSRRDLGASQTAPGGWGRRD